MIDSTSAAATSVAKLEALTSAGTEATRVEYYFFDSFKISSGDLPIFANISRTES